MPVTDAASRVVASGIPPILITQSTFSHVPWVSPSRRHFEVPPQVCFDEGRVDAIFAKLDQSHLPGAAVGIAIDGKPVYRKGFGLASMELPVVLAPTTRMRIASTTKHFTALCYLLLCEEGKAGIDDSIAKFLPDLHPVTRHVTARQLMSNVSGLRDSHDICWNFSGTPHISTADLLSFYRDIDDVNASPGATWIYNNGGWSILTAIIERITSQSLENVLRERIFEPIGMSDSLLRRFDTNFVPNSATLHMKNASGEYEKAYLGVALAGEGGIVSTIDDMLRWLAHMSAPLVGTAATWRMISTPQTLANGTSTGYGLGFMSGHYRGLEILHHAGGVNGGGAQMLKAPGLRLDIAVMVNRHDLVAAQLVEQVLDACVLNLQAVDARPIAPIIEGVFQSKVTGRVVHLFKGQQSPFLSEDHQIVSIDGFDIPARADQNGVLCPTAGFEAFKQTVAIRESSEWPDSIVLNDFGNSDELLAVKPTETASAVLIGGRFRSLVTGTEVTIEKEGSWRMRTVGRFGSVEFNLEPLSDRIWRARTPRLAPAGGVLSFDADLAAFRFSTSRTRALPFRRIA
jgi:D-aminopeptidase